MMIDELWGESDVVLFIYLFIRIDFGFYLR